MTRIALVLCSAVAVTASVASVGAQAPAPSPEVAAARGTVKRFADTLQGALVSAMQKGGPVHAITVCNTAAPAIAKGESAASGWRIGRTSHKLRNTANAPDELERKVLADFLEKAKAGADLATLEHAETVNEGGKRVFRFMKAIPVGEPCLTCHGEAVKPDTLGALAKLYPEDRATGFKLGELRGMFTLQKALD